MNTSNQSTNSDPTKIPAGIDFLDFLFTIAISVGLLGSQGVNDGILAQPWVKNGEFPKGHELYYFFVFILGLLNLIFSWYGYHGSIKKKPITYGTISGMTRFVLDVFLVIVYGFILLQFKEFQVVLFLLVITHLIFVIWDICKIVEYKGHYSQQPGSKFQRYRREIVSVVFFILFVVLFLSVYKSYLDNCTSLVIAFILIVLYRINKMYSSWERCFGVK